MDYFRIPIAYRYLIIKEILGYSEEELEEMDLEQYSAVLNYSWTTYNLRRPDLLFRNMEGKTTLRKRHPALEAYERNLSREGNTPLSIIPSYNKNTRKRK